MKKKVSVEHWLEIVTQFAADAEITAQAVLAGTNHYVPAAVRRRAFRYFMNGGYSPADLARASGYTVSHVKIVTCPIRYKRRREKMLARYYENKAEKAREQPQRLAA